jgi:hypothetical protein
MRSIEKKLKSILYRSDCPSNMDLGEYELGILDPPRRDEIASHLVACLPCQNDLQEIRQFMAVPAVGIEAKLAQAEEKAPLLERIKVILVNLATPPENIFGSGSMQPVFRGADANTTQVIEADEYLVSLSTVGENGSGPIQQMIGDIMPLIDDIDDQQGFETWTADLWHSGQLLASTTVAADSHFIFEGIYTDNKAYELILSGPSVEIHLQNLHIS